MKDELTELEPCSFTKEIKLAKTLSIIGTLHECYRASSEREITGGGRKR